MRPTLLLVLLLASPAWAQPADTTATVEHLIVDYAKHSVEQKFLILPDGKRVRLKGANRLKTGDKVKVSKAKIRKAETAHVEPNRTEAEVDVADVTVLESINPAFKPQTLPATVILVDWSIRQPWATPALTQAAYTSIESTYRLNSYGAQGWSLKFYWVTIPPPSLASCDYQGVMSAARAALLSTQGVTVSGRIQYVMENYPACGWGGIAGVYANWSVINGNFWAVAHEWWHNLGLFHSNFRSCTLSGCVNREYGDIYDPMGQGPPGDKHLNAGQKTQLQWIAPCDVTATGVYALAPYETVSTGCKALRLLIPDSVEGVRTYYVESRSLLGGAVLVHEGVVLQDIAPFTAEEDYILDVGQSAVLADGTALTALSASASGASVRVQRPVAGVVPSAVTTLRLRPLPPPPPVRLPPVAVTTLRARGVSPPVVVPTSVLNLRVR